MDEPELKCLIDTPQGWGEILPALTNSPRLAFDCETTSTNYKTGELHGIALANDEDEWYIAGDVLLEAAAVLGELSHDQDKTWLAWNAPFDLHFMKKGCDTFDPAHLIDVQVAAHMINENQSMKLKEQAALRLGIHEKLQDFKDLLHYAKALKKAKKLADVSIHDIPLEKLAPYGARDARLTYDLDLVIQPELEAEDLYERFIDVEMPFIKLLQRVEDRGIYIDTNRLAELDDKYSKELAGYLAEWDEMTEGVNPNSPQQLAKYFFETKSYKPTIFTGKGAPSTKKLVIQRLAAKDPAAKLLLQHRKLDKLVGTYIRGIEKGLYKGRLHTSLNRTGTVTGRLSSSGPNLQNIPIRTQLGKDIRMMFIPTPGYEMIVIDYSTLELRIAAHYSKDPRLLEVFLKGIDPHQTTADLIDALRTTAKTINYLKFYGGGVFAVMDKIEEDTGMRPKMSDVRRWMKAWNDVYAGITNWSYQMIDYTRQHGYVKTIGGRKRRLPEIHSPIEGVRARAERQAPNAIIQGSAADLIELAMLKSIPYLDWYGAYMLNQIHDELVFETPLGTAHELAPLLQGVMESVADDFNLIVPLRADPGIGPNWTEAKA